MNIQTVRLTSRDGLSSPGGGRWNPCSNSSVFNIAIASMVHELSISHDSGRARCDPLALFFQHFQTKSVDSASSCSSERWDRRQDRTKRCRDRERFDETCHAATTTVAMGYVSRENHVHHWQGLGPLEPRTDHGLGKTCRALARASRDSRIEYHNNLKISDGPCLPSRDRPC